jgi:hypothetical protein
MENEMSVAQIHEQIFAAPTHRLHFASGELSHCTRDRPAQARLTHLDSGDHAAFQVRHEAAARNFNLREFGHDSEEEKRLVRGTKYT